MAGPATVSRRMLRNAGGCAAALALGLMVGCPGATPGTQQRKDPSAARAALPPAGDLLGAGDDVEIRVFGEPELGGKHRIRSDGTVALPLAGRVEIRGLTPEQAAEAVRAAYRNGYLNDPEVTVTVLAFNSKKFYVLGAVGRPGVFPFDEDVTILEAIIKAGGFGAGASKNSVLVTRNVNGTPVRFEIPVDDIAQGKQKNVSVMPGDIIYVQTSAF